MKTVMFAAALMISGAAIAQDYPDTTTTTTTTTTEVIAPVDTPMPEPLAVPNPAAPASGQLVAPGNTNPELDARGIPVISDSAVVPAGFNMIPGVGGPFVDASSPPATEPATEAYPACTRTITDNCVQTYERGAGRR